MSNLTDNLKNAKSATLASFSAITVKDDQQLRSAMHQEDISYSVIKKTLLRKAFEKLGFKTDLFDGVNGNISLAISAADEVASAKAIYDFALKNNNMNIIGGILENNWIDSHKVKALAVLPAKQELLAKVVGTIKAPLSGLVNVLTGNARGLVNILKAIQDQKS